MPAYQFSVILSGVAGSRSEAAAESKDLELPALARCVKAFSRRGKESLKNRNQASMPSRCRGKLGGIGILRLETPSR